MPTKHTQLPPYTDSLPRPICFWSTSLAAETSYPWHSHSWGELNYSFSGVMSMKLAEQIFLSPPPYGIWAPPRVEHQAQARYEANHCCLYIREELCGDFPPEACAVAINPLIRAILVHLRDNHIVYPENEAENRLFLVLLDQLKLAPQQGNYLPTSDDLLLRPVLTELYEKPGDSRSLAAWAAVAHTTERTLARRCQHDLGMPFSEWRQRLRIVTAFKMLEAGRTVEAIAVDLGYGSSTAFIAMFRKMVGTSPQEFRSSGGISGGTSAQVALARKAGMGV